MNTKICEFTFVGIHCEVGFVKTEDLIRFCTKSWSDVVQHSGYVVKKYPMPVLPSLLYLKHILEVLVAPSSATELIFNDVC